MLQAYAGYYNKIRTHRSLDKDAPAFRPVQRIGAITRSLAGFIIITFGFSFRYTQAYYNQARTHLALQKNAPIKRRVQRFGRIIAIPVLAGLHHQYARI